MSLSEHYKELFDVSHKIIELHDHKFNKNSKNVILDHLSMYEKCYQRTSPEDHKEFFMKVFDRFSFDILSDTDYDWVANSDISILFNEGNPKCNPKIRIHLSAIFKKSRELIADAEKQYEKCNSTILPIEDMYPEMKYSDIFMLKLYQIFEKLMENDREYDRKCAKLKTITATIKRHLDGDDTDSNVTAQAAGPVGFANQVQPQASTPRGAAQAAMPDFGSIFANLMKNAKVKDFVQNMQKSIQSGNIQDAVPEIFGKLTSGDLLKEIASAIPQPAAAAQVGATEDLINLSDNVAADQTDRSMSASETVTLDDNTEPSYDP